MTNITEILSQFNGVSIALLVLLAIVSYLLFKAQTKKDDFDLRDMIVDESTRKVSSTKFGTLTSLVFTTWGFTYLLLHGTLTETYYLTYVSVWAGYSGIIHGISAFKSKVVDPDQLARISEQDDTNVNKR